MLYEVGKQPIQIFLGEQPVSALVNTGPYTVYLDDNASVSSTTGFELPPTGQLTWRGKRKLWAVTRDIRSPTVTTTKARLFVTPSADLAATTRAKFFDTIYSTSLASGSNTWNTRVLEVGHCATLLLSRSYASVSNGSTESVEIVWYDEEFNRILTEFWQGIVATANTFSAPNPIDGLATNLRMTIPVKGKYAVLQGLNSSGAGAPGNVKIVGTDVDLISRVDGGVYSGDAASTATYDGSIARVSGLTMNALGNAIWLPIIGNATKLVISNNAAGAVVLAVRSLGLSGPWYDLINVGAGTNVVYLLYAVTHKTISIQSLIGNFTGEITAIYPTDQNTPI